MKVKIMIMKVKMLLKDTTTGNLWVVFINKIM